MLKSPSRCSSCHGGQFLKFTKLTAAGYLVAFEQLGYKDKIEAAPLRLEALVCKECGRTEFYSAGRMDAVRVDNVYVCEIDVSDNSEPYR